MKAESHTQRKVRGKDTRERKTGYKPRRQAWRILTALRRNQPCPQLDFRLTGSTVKRFYCYCHPLWCWRALAQQAEHGCLGITLTTLHSSLLHNHTQALGQMIFLGDCNQPLVSPGLSFLPTHPLDKPLMRITFLRLCFHPIISQEDSSGNPSA